MNDKETDRKPWAEATKVVLPSFQGGGTHVNLSGVVLIKTAPNKANAVKFIEWMVSPAAQQMHADVTYEYPMRAGVPVNKTIAGYGELKRDPIALSQIAANRKKASALVDKVGFDN
jgi:iron(III) transport system substrate-binding protein